MTTTFADIQLTEKVENYMYENKEYNFQKGDVISLPKHTANRFVNKWNRAKWAKEPYEVKDSEYEDVVGRVRNSGEEDGETCQVEKSDGEVCGREKPCPYHGDEE